MYYIDDRDYKYRYRNVISKEVFDDELACARSYDASAREKFGRWTAITNFEADA